MYYCVKINDMEKNELQLLLSDLNQACGNINALICKKRTKEIQKQLNNVLDNLNDKIDQNTIIRELSKIPNGAINATRFDYYITEGNWSIDLREGIIPVLEEYIKNMK